MIYILIPIFNEEKNILNLHRELKDVLTNESKFFVFSDDGSTDSSFKVIKDCFKEIPHVVVGDGTNHGPGYAFNTGFNWILENSKNDTDVIVTIEADCTSDLTILPHMIGINKMGYNLVLASVYAQGGGFDKTSFARRFISSVANLLYRFLFNVNVLTLSSFYRVYSIDLLRKIKSKYGILIENNGFICMLEILIKSISCEAKCIEVPMVLQSNKRIGKSKMKVFKTTMQYFSFLMTFKKK